MFSWNRDGCEEEVIGKTPFTLFYVFQSFAEAGG